LPSLSDSVSVAHLPAGIARAATPDVADYPLAPGKRGKIACLRRAFRGCGRLSARASNKSISSPGPIGTIAFPVEYGGEADVERCKAAADCPGARPEG
jgi:hypothetical protein